MIQKTSMGAEKQKEEQTWLKKYLRKQYQMNLDLSDIEFRPIIDFTFIWGILEKIATETFPDVGSEVEIMKCLIKTFNPNPIIIDSTFSYFCDRYVDEDNTNYLFHDLWPEKREHIIRETVANILCGKDSSYEARNYACGMICLRIRNNLFHGVKNVETLNEQIPLFQHACNYLTNTIETITGIRIG